MSQSSGKKWAATAYSNGDGLKHNEKTTLPVYITVQGSGQNCYQHICGGDGHLQKNETPPLP